MEIRPYDAQRDRGQLWALKRAFELELSGESDGEKADAYAGKLTDDYRERYLNWVAGCVDESPDCVAVAAAAGTLEGYAFLLPESLAMIWDAAVLNEIYLTPDHRGSGIADRLLWTVLEVAETQALPMDRVVLDVAPSNDRAIGFYERHGFEAWGELVVKEL